MTLGYSPPWITCAACGVTQPAAALEHPSTVKAAPGRAADGEWLCKDVVKCFAGKAERARLDAEFKRTHPELHPGGKP